MQIAIVLYPGFTALDFIGPYEVLRWLPDTEVRFVWHQPGPIAADSAVRPRAATASARRCTSIVGMSIATGQASKQAPQSRSSGALATTIPRNSSAPCPVS